MALFLYRCRIITATKVGKSILGLLLLLDITTCYSQYTDSTKYYTGLISTGSYNKTESSSTTLFSNKLSAGVRKKSVALNFNNSWVYGQQQKTLTNNDFNSTFNCDVYKLFPHAYYWGLATYTSSFSLKINKQAQAGGGVAYNILDSKNLRLNLSDGLVYENSDVYLDDTVRDVYSTVRNSARLMFRCDTGMFTFQITTYLQNSLLKNNDYIVKADASLGIKVRKWLSLTVAYSYNRFNRTNKENTLFTYGLTLEHYY